MIGASLPPGPAAVPAAAPEHAAATTGAGGPPRAAGDAAAANGERSAPSGNAPRGDAARAGRATRRGETEPQCAAGSDAPARDFAELLAANDAAVDARSGAAAGKPATVRPEGKEPPAPDALPDPLLALLVGEWPPSPRPAPATPAAMSAGSHARVATPQLPAATTAPAPAPAAPPPATGTDAGAGSFAALAGLALEASGAVAASADTGVAQTVDAPPLPAGLAAAAPAQAVAPAPAAAPAAPLSMPADPDAGFDGGFGARVVWMAEQRIGHAEIRLNPEHVGPIDVRVQLDGNRVAAEFHSAHAEVRRAIEASMPQLREMLGQHGLQLGHADVGHRDAQNQPPAHGGFADPAGERDDATPPAPPIALPRSRGLLDEYA